MTGDPARPSDDELSLGLLLCIGLGGSLGSLARFAVARELNAPGHLAWGTLAVNLLGSLLLGAALSRPWRSRHWQAGTCVGFLGSFTTLSAVAVELHLEPERWGLTVGYLAATVLGGLLAARLGLALGAQRAGSSRP
ncbi:MAG: fluoride efflux transporter FluC [Angustibacter sp.]